MYEADTHKDRKEHSRLMLILVGSLFLPIFTFLALLGAGIIEVRLVSVDRTAGQKPTEQGNAKHLANKRRAKIKPELNPPDEPYLAPEKVGLREYWNWNSLDGMVYKYRGGLIDCWIEIETNGETKVLGKILGQKMTEFPYSFSRKNSDEIEGNIIWVRGKKGYKYEWFDLLVTGFQSHVYCVLKAEDLRFDPLVPKPKSVAPLQKSVLVRPPGVDFPLQHNSFVLLARNEEVIVWGVAEEDRTEDGKLMKRTIWLKCRLVSDVDSTEKKGEPAEVLCGQD